MIFRKKQEKIAKTGGFLRSDLEYPDHHPPAWRLPDY